MADDRKKVCIEQLNILISEIEKDPFLLNGRSSGTLFKIEYTERWKRLAKKLNMVENGVLKNVSKWQQSWRDWKSNTKKKMAKLLKEKNSSDYNSNQELTTLELRVLKLMDAEQPKTKEEGIDISSITEIDPLSSSESDNDYQHNSDSKPVFMPHMLTVYTSKIKNETQSPNGKRMHSDDDEGNIKRKRIRMTSNDSNSRQTEILESSRQESNQHNNKLLEAILSALERHAAAAARQADAAEVQARAMNRIVELLERRERES